MVALKKFQNETACEVKISSGYRYPEKNKLVGGVKGSYHIQGKALDLYFPRCLTYMPDLAKIAFKYFNGVIVYKRHIHVDIRNVPYFGKGSY